MLKGDLTGIVRARRLSAATMRNIRQNLFFAFVYNAAGVPIAAGVLYPLFGILLSPVIAAAAMALSSVSVVGNSSACGGCSSSTGLSQAGTASRGTARDRERSHARRDPVHIPPLRLVVSWCRDLGG